MKTHEAEKKQNEFAEKFDKLRAYPPRGSKYTALKESFFQNAKQFLSQIFQTRLKIQNLMIFFRAN